MEGFLAKKQANHKPLCDGLIVKGWLFFSFFFSFQPLRLHNKIFYWHPLVFYSKRDHLKTTLPEISAAFLLLSPWKDFVKVELDSPLLILPSTPMIRNP